MNRLPSLPRLLLFSLLCFATALRGPATAAPSPNVFGQPYASAYHDGSHLVLVHFMLSALDYGGGGGGASGAEAGYEQDIRDAEAQGIDGFVLNLGAYHNSPYQDHAADMFKAANVVNAGNPVKFKLCFSLDQSGNMGAADSVGMMTDHGLDPAYLTFHGKPFLSTWGGEGPYVERRDFWGRQVLGKLRSQTPKIDPYFVPMFFNRHADGTWGTDSPADIAEATKGLYSGIADGRFFSQCVTPPLDPGFAGNARNYAAATKAAHLSLMSGVSPQYWGSRQVSAGRRYVEFDGGEGMAAQWQSILRDLHPEFVEMFTWNDFDESTYFSPAHVNLYWPYLFRASSLDFYKSHAGAAYLNRYYIQWYKTGQAPKIVDDSLVYFYRPQFGTMKATEDPAGPVAGSDKFVNDVFITTLTKAPAEVHYQRYGAAPVVLPVGAGITHVRLPFGYGPQNFSLWRGGKEMLSKTDEPVETGDTFYNENYVSGFVRG